jgi:hypothetical protein
MNDSQQEDELVIATAAQYILDIYAFVFLLYDACLNYRRFYPDFFF